MANNRISIVMPYLVFISRCENLYEYPHSPHAVSKSVGSPPNGHRKQRKPKWNATRTPDGSFSRVASNGRSATFKAPFRPIADIHKIFYLYSFFLSLFGDKNYSFWKLNEIVKIDNHSYFPNNRLSHYSQSNRTHHPSQL